ncbi:hypothetical protein TURU_034592 [Turdus rufiventris]|nr:hypothetical protein TURU_034592 [Turdus rufiventris]
MMTHLVNASKAVDIVYLDFCKVFDTVSHGITLEKLAAHGLDKSTFCWVKNWLDGQAQTVVVTGAASSWGQSSVVSPGISVWGQFCLISSLVVWMKDQVYH